MDFNRRLTYPRALGIPYRVTPLLSALQTLRSLINLAIAPVSVLVTAYFIDTALRVYNENLSWGLVVPAFAALAAFTLFNLVTEPLMGLVNKKRGLRAWLTLGPVFVAKQARLAYKHVENPDKADLLKRVTENSSGQLSGMLGTFEGFAVMVGQTASYAVILLLNVPLVGALLLALAVPMFYIAMRSGKQGYQAQRDMTEKDRWFWSYNWLLTARDVAHERNLFGFTPFLTQKFMDAYEEARKFRLKVQLRWYVRSKVTSLMLGLLSAAALFMLAPSVARGALSVGLYISLLGALFSCINMIGWRLPHSFEQFAKDREYIKDVNEFFALSEAPGADALPASPPPPFVSLELKDVSFAYPGTDKMILDKLSLTIENGKHYSFVGVNGAGKTTITKLITRLYEDYEGEILLNGKSLRDWPMDAVKATFCTLFQDFAKYDVTVAENIGVGRIGASGAEIDRAIALSGFADKVKELKDGKDTPLGKTRDEGVDLSGGEWQRIAFARAIVSPASIKILDEPTAALDPMAESQVYAQFEEISKGVTTLFISHRLASAKLADVIYVLDGGKVAEQGDHAQLMAAGGLYAQMFESQRSWYL